MLRLFKRLKSFFPAIIAIILFILLQALSELYIPTLMADIVDNGIIPGNVNYVLSIGIKMILFTFCIVLFSICGNFLSSRVSAKFSERLRNDIFERVEGYSLDEFKKFGTSSLITRTTNDVTQIQTVVVIILRMMIMAPVMAVGGIIMAMRTDSGLSWIFMFALPIMIGIIGVVIIFGGKLFSSMQVKVDKLNLIMRENLTGIRVIRAFDRISYEMNRFKNANEDLSYTAIKANKIMSFVMPGVQIVMNLTTVAIVWFGAQRIYINAIEVGSLMAYIQYASLILFAFVMMSMLFVMVPRATASAKRINEVLDTKPLIKDLSSPKQIENSKDVKLEFRNVYFAYEEADEPVLENISFKAVKGDVIAVIGGTGSGKSTLINLIPRFHDVNKGEILLNGINISDLSQKDLRKRIGIVPQKAVLFSGTVKENILYGKEDATDEEIYHAAKIANADEFIDKLENGFDTFISQGGKNVSGGQKQRISIARALVRKPDIYIFDDSFSALDAKTDAKIRKSLIEETKNSISIIVAQKITSIMHADMIIVLDEGKIAGIGNHEKLLKTNDIYREMASSQLRKEDM